jgi:electron transfer flavoprotein beta subunit
MRIIVNLKQIRDPHGISVNRRAGRVFFSREDYILNPADKNALEAALLLKDADPGVELDVLTAGPERCLAVLREALAMGADYAVRLADPGRASDGAVIAHVLVAAVRRRGAFDLLLLGERALDGGMGEMGPRLAQVLDVPLVMHAHQLAVDGGVLQAVVQTPHGFVRVETDLPAVVTVARNANAPRYPRADQLIRAYREWSVDYWNAAELGLDPALLEPRLARGEPEAPPEQSMGQMSASLSAVADALRPFATGG